MISEAAEGLVVEAGVSSSSAIRARETAVCSGGKRPTGRIPALSDDDFSVSDSVA